MKCYHNIKLSYIKHIPNVSQNIQTVKTDDSKSNIRANMDDKKLILNNEVLTHMSNYQTLSIKDIYMYIKEQIQSKKKIFAKKKYSREYGCINKH